MLQVGRTGSKPEVERTDRKLRGNGKQRTICEREVKGEPNMR
jgi:hypothetical protein